jgi:hypothetical protein
VVLRLRAANTKSGRKTRCGKHGKFFRAAQNSKAVTGLSAA